MSLALTHGLRPEARQMRMFLVVAALFAILSGCVRISPAIPAWPSPGQDDLTLAARDGFVIAAEVNGRPVRLRVDTAYSGVILNPGTARAIGLVASRWENDVTVGPVHVQGETAVATLSIGGQVDRRRIVWFERDIAPDADGVINIASLPYATITLSLRSPQPDEERVEFQTTPKGFWSVIYPLAAGEKEIDVRFVLAAPRTLVSAAAGAELASSNGGTWAGDATAYPVSLDVVRPVRPMRFARPVAIQNLSLGQALIRTSDYRGREALPPEQEDPSEIVVTASQGRSRAQFNMMIGRDHLERCSSLTYETRTRKLALSCRPGQG